MKETNLGYDKKVTNAFIRFLRENGITRRYQHNCVKYRSGQNYDACMKFIRSVESVKNKNYLFIYPFYWARTKEGNIFWSKIYDKWDTVWGKLHEAHLFNEKHMQQD